ncbi:hypothetical protein RND71_023936 [Anisodus tanguticus]|uniref:AP2/ERF domain-containing protein n=1 Tax=Anisodus tanguticus TaxID=243964 RepID=A0AAE1RWL3_9SOLA|nr:hypothetical protein RND71_023936 [Anisodus tanguticus]
MKSQKRKPKSSSVRLFPGVRKRKNGKFCSEIKHPFNKKMIWLGTFITAEEAFESYKSKKVEFEELVMVKIVKNGQKCEKPDQESSSSNDSLMDVADENTNSSNGIEEKKNIFAGEEQEIGNESDEELFIGHWVQISDGREVKISRKLGVPIVDNYGFLLGEFSVLDDLRIYM